MSNNCYPIDVEINEKYETLHQLLVRKGRLFRRSKGQIVQSTDEQKTFNLVKSGYVKRYLITNEGALGVGIVYGPGDVFSITLAFKVLLDQAIYQGPEVYYYEAMSDTELYTLEISELVKSVEENPLLFKDLMSESGKRLRSTLQSLENITMKNSYKRVAHQLVYYSKRFGQDTPAGTKILPPLTHQDIADILSLTRETVSTCMVRLRRKGLIVSDKRIIVPSIEKLESEAFG